MSRDVRKDVDVTLETFLASLISFAKLFRATLSSISLRNSYMGSLRGVIALKNINTYGNSTSASIFL